MIYAQQSSFVITKVSLIATSIAHGAISVYPLYAALKFLHGGHLHQLLSNLVQTKYLHPKYLADELFGCIEAKATELEATDKVRCRGADGAC